MAKDRKTDEFRAYRRAYYASRRDEINAVRRANWAANSEKYREKTNAYREANREKYREGQRKWIKRNWTHIQRYNQDFKAKLLGASLKWYEARYEEQGGRCEICSDHKPRLCIDHDHATGEVRGLLCHRCNRGLGYFRDEKPFLVAAGDYVERYRKRDLRLEA